MTEYTPDQELARSEINEWMQEPGPSVRKITGLAGTGKTYLITEIDPTTAYFCAPTGKAAQNMIDRGIRKAKTIHRLIYNVDRYSGFNLKPPAALKDHHMIVIDEASMISSDIWDDLMTFQKKILICGDPLQLPPVGDDPSLLASRDIHLETIHRQAADSPIISFAHKLREPTHIPSTPVDKSAGDSTLVVCSTNEGMNEALKRVPLENLAVITARNSEKRKINKLIREQLGRTGTPFEEGDILVCRKNNYEHGIFNGQLFRVTHIGETEPTTLSADLESLDSGEHLHHIPVSLPFFNLDGKLNYRKIPRTHGVFDFGYCLTAHFAQGSEFENVLVLEPKGLGHMFSGSAHRWRYTAATRARKTLIYGTPYIRGTP